jgi:imidazolonepropionase-like amidohydrolase
MFRQPFDRALPGLALVLALVSPLLLRSAAQAPALSSTLALTGGRVIDGTGGAPLERATLVVRNGRIDAVSRETEAAIPPGATRIDVSGKTIIPGLINAHAHVNNGDPALPLFEQLVQQMRLYAKFGVTSAVTLGDDGKESVRVRDDNERSALDRARLFVAGPPVVAKTIEEARQLIDHNAELGVNVIKTRMNGNANDMTPPVYTAVIERAHQRGLPVAAHLYYLKDARGLVEAGLDIVAHSVRDQDVDNAFVAELKRRNVAYIPTLTRDLSVFVYEATPAFFNEPFFLRGGAAYEAEVKQLRDPALQQKTKASVEAQTIKKALDQAKRNLKRLADGGVTIAMGTDSGTGLGRWQGYFEHVEMEMMVEAGMSPMQALVAATGAAARAMRLDGEIGTIAPGKRADFVVLNADPLTDIRNSRQIDAVWIAGRKQ